MRSFRVALAIGVLAATTAHADEAVVLSSGSARGLAHAGVLVGLERRQRDPDIVVGSSMGAVIGALYASGMAPDSVWKIVERERWRNLLSPLAIPIGFERSVRDPALTIESGRGAGLGIRGFLADWRVNRELVRWLFAASARTHGDFDRLARRFRAVSVDLETGNIVILARGDLARAVRASVAAPGFLPPARWGSQKLIDGGVRDYLPLDVARQIGATFTVASDVIEPLAEPARTEASAVAGRAIDILTIHAHPVTPPADVTVHPRLSPAISSIVYPQNPAPLLRAGLEAALAARFPPSAPESIRRRRSLPPPVDRVSVLRVDAPPYMEGFLRDGFAPAIAGRFDDRRILDRVDRAYATGFMAGVWPSVEDTAVGAHESGTLGLFLHAEGWGALSLQGAAGFDDDRGGRIWGSLRHRGHLGGAPIQVAIEGLGDGLRKWGAASLLVPSMSRLVSGASAGAYASSADIRFLAPGDVDVRRAGGWMGIETRRFDPDVFGSLTFRAENIRSDAGVEGESFGPTLALGTVSPLVRVVGLATGLEIEGRAGAAHYGRARASVSRTMASGLWFLAPLAEMSGATRRAPLDSDPALGDEGLVPGLEWGERRGRARLVLGADVARVIPMRTTAVLRLRAGKTAEPLAGGDEDWVGGASLSTLWWLPLGRIEAGYAAATTGDRRVFVRLGPDF